MPRILVISPNFPPVNTPDMQRVRMSLPYFVDAGWEIVVLAADDREPQAPLEPELLRTIPGPVRVIRVQPWRRSWTRWIGLNNLGLRGLVAIWRAGRRAMEEASFDLVYFSTTQVILFPLGRLWQAEFNLPYVIDLQDPWLSDYYARPGAPRPPGGWKYRFAHFTARLLEGWTLARAAHVISVSEAYLTTLRQRYPWFGEHSGSVLTFGAPDADFALARQAGAGNRFLLPAGQRIRIAYAGRLGGDMLPALEILFAALARLPGDQAYELFFFGTSYAAGSKGVATTTDLAHRYGLESVVHETPSRIGYIDSLRIMLETDVGILLGSSDQDYSPSKLYPTLLAARPTLAIAPRESVLAAKIGELGGANLVAFDPGMAPDPIAVEQVVTLLTSFARDRSWPAPAARLAVVQKKYTAAAVAVAQLEIFHAVIAGRRINPSQISTAESAFENHGW